MIMAGWPDAFSMDFAGAPARPHGIGTRHGIYRSLGIFHYPIYESDGFPLIGILLFGFHRR